MSVSLKKLSEQVVVITGASSGIGLATARAAAEQGARLVLAARNSDALSRIATQLRGQGADVETLEADVGFQDDVKRVAALAIERFGGFDTWVNNAGVSIYGRIDEVTIDDHRRLFETNYWGVVYGSLVAAEHLRERGGALINIGSMLSDRAIPLQGPYCASKHAVKGFTDAFRMELEKVGAPISVTLVKPSGIATPYHEHAKNYQEHEPRNAPPVYAPELVAKEILHAAQKPVRDVTVGGGGKALAAMGEWMPRVMDRVMEKLMFELQHTERKSNGRRDNLFEAGDDGEVRGHYDDPVLERSLFNVAGRHPLATGLFFAGAGLALTLALRARRG